MSFWETLQLFSDPECDELESTLDRIPAVRDVASQLIVTPIPMEPNRKLYEHVFAALAEANARTWQFQLDGWLSLQALTYEVGASYPLHSDLVDLQGRGRQFKLAASILLSEPAAFDGGELEIMTGVGMDHGVLTKPSHIAPLERRGSGVVFPSFLIHRITPVTRGERLVLVARAGGPPFA